MTASRLPAAGAESSPGSCPLDVFELFCDLPVPYDDQPPTSRVASVLPDGLLMQKEMLADKLHYSCPHYSTDAATTHSPSTAHCGWISW